MTRPPLLLLAAYRLFAWRLGPAYQDWTYDDITRRGYTMRQSVPVLTTVGALLAGVFAASGHDPRPAIGLAVGAIAISFLLSKALRERALHQQGLTGDGDVASWFADDRARRRRNLTGLTSSVVFVGAAVVLLTVRR